MIVELIFVDCVELGEDNGVDSDACCIFGRDSEYSLGSSRPHFMLLGLSLISFISMIVGVTRYEDLLGLIRSLTRINNLIGLSDDIE